MSGREAVVCAILHMICTLTSAHGTLAAMCMHGMEHGEEREVRNPKSVFYQTLKTPENTGCGPSSYYSSDICLGSSCGDLPS